MPALSCQPLLMVQVLVAKVVETAVMARVLEERKKKMALVQVGLSFPHSVLQVAGQVQDWSSGLMGVQTMFPWHPLLANSFLSPTIQA